MEVAALPWNYNFFFELLFFFNSFECHSFHYKVYVYYAEVDVEIDFLKFGVKKNRIEMNDVKKLYILKEL